MGKKVELTNIGVDIYSTLKDLVGNRVYPLVAEQSTNFPFIIYRTSASRPVNSKDDLWCDWQYNIVIDCVDAKYDSVVSLCDDALERLHTLEQDYEAEVISVNETYQDDAYVREIEIVIKK